jgi:hypothetical protein
MAITKGVNTYATLAEAYEYLKYRLDTTQWDSADELRRESALVTATDIIDTRRWVGTLVSESQSLAFPRIGEYYDPFSGYIVKLSTTIPTRIFEATCELAYHLLLNEDVSNDVGTVENVQIGSVTLSNVKNADIMPSLVVQKLRPLMANGGAYSWWRAN